MTLLEISVLAESLRSSPIAPLLLILSSRVLTNCFPLSLGKHQQLRYPYQQTLGLVNTTIYCQGVRKDSVSGNWLMSPIDVKCWVPKFDILFHRESIWNEDAPLGTLFIVF